MARRTMTLRRIDPWSVLKFGFVVNLCLLVVFVLGFAILWFIVGQLGLVDQACQLAEDVGFEDCGVDTGALFRVVLLVGVLGTVILTGLAVFGAFLHNLLADLVGGVQVTFSDDSAARSSVMRPGSETRRPAHRDEPSSGSGGPDRAEGDDERWTLGTPPPRSPSGTGDRTERVGGPPPGSDDDEDVLFGRRDDRGGA